MPATVMSGARPSRCCRCAATESTVFYPIRPHGVTLCGACYTAAIMDGVHLDLPIVPVPV